MSADLESPVSVLMTPNPLCVGVRVDVATAARLLLQYEISGLPVVDEENRPVAMFTQQEALRASADPSRLVGDIASSEPLVISESQPISDAIALLSCERRERISVVGAEGELVGILSALDLLRWMARHRGYMLELRHTRQL